MKKKKIAWREIFTMYITVDWKLSKKVRKALKKNGFKAKKHRDEDMVTDDDEIRVTVTPETAAHACKIIKSIIQ